MQTRQHITANVVKPELFVDVSYWVWRLSNDCHPTSSVFVMRHSPERLHQCPNNYSVYFFQTHNVFGKILQHWIKSLFLSPACKMYDNKNISSSYRNIYIYFLSKSYSLVVVFVCVCFCLFCLCCHNPIYTVQLLLLTESSTSLIMQYFRESFSITLWPLM